MPTSQDRERIGEEEAVRNELRRERRRQPRPRLLAIGAVWTVLHGAGTLEHAFSRLVLV